MSILSLPQIATLASYVFIILVYSVKIIKIAVMPRHLRWELYPVVHEKGYKYGGAYFEKLDWWKMPNKRNVARSIAFKIRDYIVFPGYFRHNKVYWLGLYCWHMGFYAIVCFHILCFFSAIIILNTSISISAESADMWGLLFYYSSLIIAVVSFILGSLGSIILLIKRLTDNGLNNYATISNFFNYLFFLLVFISGFISWHYADHTFSAYREFWMNLVYLKYHMVEPLIYIHIILFSLFLIYLPFTRSIHYITKIFAFFGVLWDDVSILGQRGVQRDIRKSMNKQVSWSAQHIHRAKTWVETVKGMPEDKS
jgi:nitrate reductase gamma subunit